MHTLVFGNGAPLISDTRRMLRPAPKLFSVFATLDIAPPDSIHKVSRMQSSRILEHSNLASATDTSAEPQKNVAKPRLETTVRQPATGFLGRDTLTGNTKQKMPSFAAVIEKLVLT